SLYFLYRLLVVGNRKLLDPYVWLTVISTVSALLYLWPSQLPLLTPLYNFLQFQFVLTTAVDCFIFGKTLPKPLNTLAPFLCLFFNCVILGFATIGNRDTHLEQWPVNRDS